VTITRIVVLVVGVAALVAALPTLRGNAASVQEQVSNWVETHGGSGKGQSAEQISSGEFASAHAGMTPAALRNLVGSPADENTVKVEDLKLECWYYGVAGATGAYQFCFQDGKLSSKRRFATG
jgi:transcription elongation factor